MGHQNSRNLDDLIKKKEFEKAALLAKELGLEDENTLESNFQLTQIYLELFRNNKKDSVLIEKSIHFAEKVSEQLKEKENLLHPFFKAYRVAASAFGEALVHSNVKSARYKKVGDTDSASRESQRAGSYGDKAIKLLEASSAILETKLNEAEANGDDTLKLLNEKLQISNSMIKCAFQKLSPPYALKLLSERKNNFGLFNRELFGNESNEGLDINYFVSKYRAFLALNSYDRADATKLEAQRICDLTGSKIPEKLETYFKNMLNEHLKIKGITLSQPEPRIIQAQGSTNPKNIDGPERKFNF